MIVQILRPNALFAIITENVVARRAGEMEFGETEDMHEEADAELMSGINGSGFTPAPDTEFAVSDADDADGEDTSDNEDGESGNADAAEESDTEDADGEDAQDEADDDSADGADAAEAEDDDTYGEDADDDTYDYEPSDKNASSSQIKDSDLDKIFSFDIDEIMNDGK